MSDRVYKALAGTGEVFLGKTLPDLLYEACDAYPNERAFNQRGDRDWTPLSLSDFRQEAELLAQGLIELGLSKGDRVALFMESDVGFCVADMACLIAGIVDVPIYLTHGEETVAYVLDHSGARALFVSDAAALERVSGLISRSKGLENVFVGSEPGRELKVDSGAVAIRSFEQLRDMGRRRRSSHPDELSQLRSQLEPSDVATIIYTSGTTGRPKGVVLSHENISYNALTAFSGLTDYASGANGETVISFLPLTHVFARTLQYGFIAHGTSVYFTDPDHLSEDLKRVRPTIFASVPRLLEKVYTKIRERAALEKGVKQRLLNWALGLAHRYRVGESPSGSYKIQLALANRIVFSKWRDALGGRVKYIISGGAALNPELAGVFAAAGVKVLQGYGLTETSPIISYNRPEKNRPETVGTLLPGLEVRIADDGEILTRGPHVMKGYFNDPERTAETIDEEGWLHTGDVGEMTDDGFLKLTDRKKDLFKLSTGKYVMPQPLESRMTSEPLVEQVVVVGSGYKYCTALIFPDQDVLRTFARSRGIDHTRPIEELLRNPKVVARYERIVDKANRGLDPWSTVKRFALIPEHLSVESGLLTPTMKVRRSEVRTRFADAIDALYDADLERHETRDRPTDDHAEAVAV